MKFLMRILILFLLTELSFAGEPEKTIVFPGQISYEMSLKDTFTVIPEPGWTLQPGRYLALRFGEVLIRGNNDSFSLQLNFFCDTPDLAKFDSPEKQKRFLNRSNAAIFRESLEKERKLRVQVRPFAPFGRYGYAVRFTDRRYAAEVPSKGEWKYLTAGILRLSPDSVLSFSLLTNSVDNEAYLKLLDYIAAFTTPEKGDEGWTIDGAAANRIATEEFAKRYPEESLAPQRPYTVVREGKNWLVHGNQWILRPGGVAEAEIDGATGKVLRVSHGK